MTERSYYITEFTDEFMPCEPTLEGWAAWLAKPDGDDDCKHGPVVDGQEFAASAIRWLPDIVATRKDGAWSLSEQPDEDDFIAVRFGKVLGWSADNIPCPTLGVDPATGEYGWIGTNAEILVKWLRENDEHCEDVEYVARGVNEDGWLLTFHAGQPARCTAERAS